MITTDYFRQKLNKKGMTLVEVIVAVVIVAISALLLLTSFSASLNLVNHGDKMNTLANEAFAQVEQLAAEDYNNSLTFHGVVDHAVSGKYLQYKAGEGSDLGNTVTFYIFAVEP
ncbi:MAG: prepilin-type N-terminal cleavage/methylation domain-containing protein [Clostridia bacterium]|nr:prepilin-type N-terminal cleavage/methylation domain-containing protein [Clostridia bacterium]